MEVGVIVSHVAAAVVHFQLLQRLVPPLANYSITGVKGRRESAVATAGDLCFFYRQGRSIRTSVVLQSQLPATEAKVSWSWKLRPRSPLE